MDGGNAALTLKHHILAGRLRQIRLALAAAEVSLEDCCDEDGNTPLHWCAQGLQTEQGRREASAEETCLLLLQHSAPKNRQNNLGETPLLTAVRAAVADPAKAEVLIREMLGKAAADPCRADLTGETPIMEACAAGLEPIARLLLECKADPLASSTSGMTAAQLAEESGNDDVVTLLKSPLAVRAAREARTRAAGEATEEASTESYERKEAQRAQRLGETLFGQKLRPGLAKDAPGKPYPEYGTLHDID